ncbi:MAG: COR domain-containing protein [Cyanobacteria bacterium P01_G01_bin.54]
MTRDGTYWEAVRRIEEADREGAKELDLSGWGLTELPEVITSLTQLQRLYLDNNQLTELPEVITSLTQLQRLYLDNNQLTELPEAIAALTQLQRLDLNNNQLTELPEAIAALTQLEELYLEDNQLTELPEAIASLTQLKWLELNNNQLTELPEVITSLTQLQRLDLNNNQLTELPEAIASLTQLEELYLEDNPLNPDLAAAYHQGINAVKQYLRAKAEAQLILNEAKLILVGEGEVGKTCLLGALRDDPWIDGRPTTHGIEIKPVSVTAPDGDTEITLNGWDFGGQQVYRPTHQLFFSSAALYLVVWKPREGPQQGFVKDWITLIKHRVPDAKVIVVATHGGPSQRQPDIDRQELLDLFGNETIQGFFFVDSKPDPETGNCNGIAALKTKISEVAAALPGMGRTIPAKWKNAQDALKASGQPYVTYDAALKIYQDQGVDVAAAEQALRIYHTLGNLIHYHYDELLKDIVILKPDWLAKAISFVLDDPTTRHNNGLIDFAHLGQLWLNPPYANETGYPAPLHPIFLRLMERFDLSYKVVLDAATQADSTTSLIAQLVPDNRPEPLPWPDQPETGERQQTQICRIVDERGQLANAEGIFYQLIVRLHRYSLGRADYGQSIHWQRGLILDDDYNGRAILLHIGTNIQITVQGVYPEFFLTQLTREVKWLVESFWEGLNCEIVVPCIMPCGKNQPGLGQFEVEKLITSKKKGRTDYPCNVSGCDEWQNIDQLMRNAPAQPIVAQLEKSYVQQELQTLRQTIARAFVEKDRRDQVRAREIFKTLDRNQAEENRRDQARTEKILKTLDKNQKTLLSQANQQYDTYMQLLVDEAKDGPRLYSIKSINTKFLDQNPRWVTAKFEVTFWCEHSRLPVFAIPTQTTPEQASQPQKLGVYTLELKREWLTKAAPWIKPIATVLSIITPLASSTAKLALNDAQYQILEAELEFTNQSLALTSQGTADILALQEGVSLFGDEYPRRVEGSALRQLHAFLKEKDPSLSHLGLVRVQNKRQEFLWVHPKFVGEY